MANITHNDFSGGWRPSDDPINGAPNGLLKMDNLDLDTNGALSLIGGTATVGSAYSSNLHTLYSRTMGGSRKNYGADTGGAIFRDNTSIGTGGDSAIAAFGTAFNYVLACSGTKRIKDSGSGTAVPLGVGAATAAPTFISADLPIDAPAQTWSSLQANYVMFVGTDSLVTESNYGGVGHGGSHARPAPIKYLQVTADANGDIAVQTYNGGGPYDMTALTSTFGGTGTATDDDIIPFFGYVDSPWGCSLQIDILLSAGNSVGNQVPDFYTYKVDDLSTVNFDSYTGAFYLILKRSDFTRVGVGSQTWTTTYGYRITFKGASGQVLNLLGGSLTPAVGDSMFIYGGSNAQNGSYQFAQVNVNNTGSYLAISPMGPISAAVSIISSQAYVVLQAPSDSQVNEVWLFARSSGGTNGLGIPSLLDQWYRVAKLTSAFTTNFHVALGDLDALKLNIKYNTNLTTIASTGVSDKILAIVGPIQSRWYYFTSNLMYPSAIDNPDLVDPTIAVRLTGSTNEVFLWAKQVDRATVLVGTSVDVYVLSGTFSTLPDFTIDIYYHGLGCKYPPISYDADVYNGDVVYLANDGWRIINAQKDNPLMVSPTSDSLYKGLTRYGYSGPNLKIAPGSVRFPICIAKNKIWCFITGTNRCEVFDFTRKYWRTFNYGLGDTTCVAATQDGQVLCFYSGDKKLREIDIKTSKLIDGATKQTIAALFPVKDGGSPRNRKDSETFKARIYSNNDNVVVAITNDLGSETSFAAISSGTAATDKFFDLSSDSNIALCKTYQVKITGTVSDFVLEDWSINYTQRPDQSTFVRVLANNFGTSAYKRLFSHPFQLDCIGNSVTVTPYLDGTAYTPLVVTSNYKKSFTYEYPLVTTDVLKARDFEYTLNAPQGLFEFYGFQEPRNVEVFPEPRLSYVVPVTNFGSPNKKRLRVWPFVIDPRGGTLTFTPIVDQVPYTALNATFSHTGKKLVLVHYTSDVFGIEYSGYWSCATEWEHWETLPPTIVQTLPVAKRFDQIGPEEFFRYGKIKQFELRILPLGSELPYTIFFADAAARTGTLRLSNGVEDSYYVDVPKGTSGRITRITFGPTTFDFHRFYVRILVAESGKDTESRWVSVE